MKKAASRVGYFSEIAEIFSTAQTALSAHRQQKYNINLSVYTYYLGDITLYVRPYERTKRHKTEMGLGPHRHLKVVAVVVFSDL